MRATMVTKPLKRLVSAAGRYTPLKWGVNERERGSVLEPLSLILSPLVPRGERELARLACGVVALLLLVGCAGPPRGLERKFFTVTTNTVSREGVQPVDDGLSGTSLVARPSSPAAPTAGSAGVPPASLNV